MAAQQALPFQTKAHDSLRLGLPALREDALPKHPVEVIQQEAKQKGDASKLQMLRDLYGAAVPAKLSIETQILGRFGRLPGTGVSSSMLGLEAMTGTLDDFSFESYLGLPENDDRIQPDMHSQLAERLKLGLEPQTQGFF